MKQFSLIIISGLFAATTISAVAQTVPSSPTPKPQTSSDQVSKDFWNSSPNTSALKKFSRPEAEDYEGVEKNLFKTCRWNFRQGTPPRLDQSSYSALKTFDICYQDFSVLYSGTTKTPVYCAYKVDTKKLRGNHNPVVINAKFVSDERIPKEQRSSPDSYVAQNFSPWPCVDRNFLSDKNSLAASYLTTSIWGVHKSILDDFVSKTDIEIRNYIQQSRSEGYVVLGAFYDPANLKIGKERTWVPAAFFKVFEDTTLGTSFAFWIENKSQAKPEKVTRIDLETRLGILF